jgi:hypothetical protein
VAAAIALPVGVAACPAPATGHTLPANARFYVPSAPAGSGTQILDLLKHHDVKDVPS